MKILIIVTIMLFFSGLTITDILVANPVDNYDLIIITPTIFSDEMSILQQHKQQHGISTQIVTLDDIYNGSYFPAEGRDNPEKIKYFIKNSKENWNVKYIMLVGGKEYMPVRYSIIYSDTRLTNTRNNLLPDFFFKNLGELPYITDLYYADIYDENDSFCSWDSNNNSIFGEMNSTTIIDKVDLFPDICIGRILCSSSSEVTTVIDKIINYENNAFNQAWFNNLILTGGDEHPNILIENSIPIVFRKLGRTAWEGEYMGSQVAKYLDNFNAKKIFASGLIRPAAKLLTKQNINNAINEGAGLMLIAGHGSTSAIATHLPYSKRIWMPLPSGYSSYDIQNLSNGEKLPVTVLCACSAGDFDSSSSPIAWEFVKHDNGGAIACFAPTCEANVMPSTLCTKTLLGHLAVGVFISYSDGQDIIGEIWKESIDNYLNDEDALSMGSPHIKIGPLIFESGIIWENHLNVEQWELFGDPTLKIGGYP